MIKLVNSILAKTISLTPKSIAKMFARQYVAGESIEEVLKVAERLNQQGFKTTIDILGEHCRNKSEISQVVADYKELYKKINERRLDSNISIKPTHIGLDISYDTALNNLANILNNANQFDNFLRIDMESSKRTDHTLNIYNELIKNSSNVGIVLQAYLHRTYSDLKNLKNLNNLNFRICKGIYNESSEIAFKDSEDINRNYLKIVEYAFQNNIYIGIATHDKRLIKQCYQLIDKYNIDTSNFEFQVLYGVPIEEYLNKHKEKKYNIRVYIPYGKDWYKYSLRRIKENPNILKYVLKNLFKLQ